MRRATGTRGWRGRPWLGPGFDALRIYRRLYPCNISATVLRRVAWEVLLQAIKSSRKLMRLATGSFRALYRPATNRQPSSHVIRGLRDPATHLPRASALHRIPTLEHTVELNHTFELIEATKRHSEACSCCPLLIPLHLILIRIRIGEMSSTRIYHNVTKLPIASTACLIWATYQVHRIHRGTHPWSSKLEAAGISSSRDITASESTSSGGMATGDAGGVSGTSITWTNLNGVPIPTLEGLLKPFGKKE